MLLGLLLGRGHVVQRPNLWKVGLLSLVVLGVPSKSYMGEGIHKVTETSKIRCFWYSGPRRFLLSLLCLLGARPSRHPTLDTCECGHVESL